MDECRSIAGICRNGQCENTIGSFRCRCPPEFQLSQSGRECIGAFFKKDFCAFFLASFSVFDSASVDDSVVFGEC